MNVPRGSHASPIARGVALTSVATAGSPDDDALRRLAS